jgi:hypothetical protein
VRSRAVVVVVAAVVVVVVVEESLFVNQIFIVLDNEVRHNSFSNYVHPSPPFMLGGPFTKQIPANIPLDLDKTRRQLHWFICSDKAVNSQIITHKSNLGFTAKHVISETEGPRPSMNKFLHHLYRSPTTNTYFYKIRLSVAISFRDRYTGVPTEEEIQRTSFHLTAIRRYEKQSVSQIVLQSV